MFPTHLNLLNAAMVLAIATGTWNVLIELVMPTAGPQWQT